MKLIEHDFNCHLTAIAKHGGERSNRAVPITVGSSALIMEVSLTH